MTEPIKVAVACPGVGHVERGYERFAAQLTQRMSRFPDIEVVLLAGSGKSVDSTRVVLRVPRRDGRLVAAATWLFGGRGRGSPTADGRSAWSRLDVFRRAVNRRLPVSNYEIEAAAFAVRLLLWMRHHRPDVVVLQDVPVARVVGALRRHVGVHTKILFINGAPWPPPYRFADAVQHLTPATLEHSLMASGKWTDHLLPCAVDAPGPLRTRRAARRRFGLPDDAFIVLSVGARNDHHKRHVTTIREVAQIEDALLVIAGAADPEEEIVGRAAHEHLPGRHQIGAFDGEDLAALYAAADAYVLASTVEGFGIASVEAAMAGLPVIVHDGAVQRWVLGDAAVYVDVDEPGAIATALRKLRASDAGPDKQSAALRDRLSWDALEGAYADLIRSVAEQAQDPNRK